MHAGSISTVEYIRPSAANVFCCWIVGCLIVRLDLSWGTVMSALEAWGMTSDHCWSSLDCVDGCDELDSVWLDMNFWVMAWYCSLLSKYSLNVEKWSFAKAWLHFPKCAKANFLSSSGSCCSKACPSVCFSIIRLLKSCSLFNPGWFAQAGPKPNFPNWSHHASGLCWCAG